MGGARSSSISGALHRKSAEISTRRGGPRGFRCWLQGSLREPGGLGPPAPPPAWEEPRRPQPHSTAEPGGASGTEARDAAGPSARSATLRLHVPSSERSKSQNLLAQAETPPSCPPLLPFSGGGKTPPPAEPGTRPGWCRELDRGLGPGRSRSSGLVVEASLRCPRYVLFTISLRPSEPCSSHAPPPQGVPCPHARGRPPAALQERATDQTPSRPRSPGQRPGSRFRLQTESLSQADQPASAPGHVAALQSLRGRPVLGSNPSSAHGLGTDAPPPSISERKAPVSRLPEGLWEAREGTAPRGWGEGSRLDGPSSLAGSQPELAGLRGARQTAAGHLLGECQPGRWLAPGASAVGTN